MTTTTKRPRSAKRRKPKQTITKTYPVVLPKPTDNIIPIETYINDAKNRWKVHLYEWNELKKDIKWVIDYAKPYVKDTTSVIHKQYSRFF